MRDRVLGRYIVLGLLLLVTGMHLAGNLWSVSSKLLNPAGFTNQPAPIMAGTRTMGGGPFWRHEILAIEGKLLTAYQDYYKAWNQARPGAKLRFTLRTPTGEVVEQLIPIPDQRQHFSGPANIVLSIVSDIAVPILALLLGFGVAFIRPYDRNAWLLLFLMMSFAEVSRNSQWYGFGYISTTIWTSFWSMTWPVWMLLFGINFPNRLASDERRPWLKLVLIAPLLAAVVAIIGITTVWNLNIEAALPFRPLLLRLYIFQTIVGMVAIGGFFACLGFKSAIEKSPDAKRRLIILRSGASVALTPLFCVVIWSILHGHDPFSDIPWQVTVVSLLFTAIFPLTLAYVIVVGRAMNLSFVIRQGVRYGLARVGLWVVRAIFAGLGIAFVVSAARGKLRLVDQVRLTAFGIGLLAVRQRTTEKASQWVDRKFFREAYDTEKVLSELAEEAGHYVEIGPLVENVAKRISNVLHVEDVIVLLFDGPSFVSKYVSHSEETSLILPETGVALPRRQITAALLEYRRPLSVYFDRPEPWLRNLSVEESHILVAMRSQILVPLIDKNKLCGILSLGAKRSEAPWTPTDLRLLQAIASQMALAVENSRLLTSLAQEAADREKANNEIAIAREVQDRLFPQKFPQLSGIECCGLCRPARGIGGDYYDVLHLNNDQLGIAIGDVSGKGIPAALLMACLQASLRGQTMATNYDLGTLMNNVNKLVYDASSSNRYATFFYGEFDTVTRKLRFVNAGHNPPVILRGDEVVRLEAGGPVVGLLAGASYTCEECTLQIGDIFIGFTDGISEALNEQDEEWEEDRFIAAAREARDRSSREIIDAIFKAADEFTGKARQYDDMTLLVVKLGSQLTVAECGG